MSERGRGHAGASRPWSDEELLHWLLDPAGRGGVERSQIAARSDDAARLTELEAFVGGVKVACAEAERAPEARERALVELVLARTTREDLSWRGDLRLVRGYLGSRLRSSLALRVAAASLLFHFLALPVVAWYGWYRAEPEQPQVRFELSAPDAPFEEAIEPEPEMQAETPPDELELELVGEPGSLYVENSLRWARHAVRDGAPELPALAGEEPAALTLLRARCELVRGGAIPGPRVLAPESGAGRVERVLWVELLLDRALLESRVPPELEAALVDLATDRLPESAEGLLAGGALARAESYGLLPYGARDVLAQARLDLVGLASGTGLIARGGELRRVAPLDPAWRRTLSRCAEARAWPPGPREALLAWPAGGR